ncbi:MAG: flagellar basal-body rod protein FlgG [Comamonas sp.]
MINSLFIAKTGMEAMQTQLDVISHNLANVSTTGYKRASAQFQDLMYQNLRQVGSQNTEQNLLPTGLQLGLGVKAVATSRDFSDGSRQATAGKYDVAIDGAGFFAIDMPDGTTGYTRDGSFQVVNNQLVTHDGYPVQGGITIPSLGSVSIGLNGEVQLTTPPSTVPATIGSITVATFINPAGLEPRGKNLYTETAASGAPMTGTPGTNGIGSVMHGYLENSNVSAVQELVTMIQTQRAYEMNSKAIQTSDQMLAKLAQL